MSVQPSSLIFLVIIAVWAAYFVQYWVRRREHLATAHSVDQFSETMRVLERRSPLPATDLSAPSRPSYAVSPARAVRAQVLIKRAETTTFTMTPSGAVTPAAASTPAFDASAASNAPADDGHTWDVESAAQIRPARAVRGLTLLAALLAFVVALPLAGFGVIAWAGVLVPLAAVAGAFVWLRQAVAAEQAARRAARRSHARPAARNHEGAARRTQAARPTAGRAPSRSAGRPEQGPATGTSTRALTPTSDEGEPVAARAGDELYDVQEVERELAAPATPVGRPDEVLAPAASAPGVSAPRPLVDEDDIPLTWDPVPVPRPTYTMKSRATRPAPTSADLVGDADTEYARYEQEPVRRVAGA